MNLANRRRQEEFILIREALHFQQVSEAMEKKIRMGKAEGQYQFMKRRAIKHAQEFSVIRRGLEMEELYLAMKARMKQPNLNATWPISQYKSPNLNATWPQI